MTVAKNLEQRSALDGKYALVREIGSGSSGTVYEAEHLVVGKRVAIKVMNPGAFADPAYRDHFVSEARAAARIAHANVVDIHDLGLTPEGVPYLVMELLRGETLEDIIDSRGALPPTYACELMLQVLAALSAAHAQGFLHLDLKPANVMVTHPRPDRPHVKVLDFGIARQMREADGTSAKGTGGTPMFMAPEQARGEAVDARSDIYSASAVLYAMLAGQDPFEGKTAGAVLERVVRGDFVPLGQANPRVPKLLAAIVERGLSLEPRRRIESAEEFAELLHPFVSDAAAALSLGPQRRLFSDPIPLVASPREITIQEVASSVMPNPEASERPPRESSVMPIHVASYARGITDSVLIAPRFPRSASTPRLEVGKDFMPSPGEAGWAELQERRSLTRVPSLRRTSKNAWPALIAILIGFGIGVVIAWFSGVL
ncbi:MAG TPA: serine/threonine-protein kinase [Polyangiaceae bacterium]|jgi:serine/threonine-protein kinase|nr:serine/threonine-protein kinase [Polyangiaceae bacterium]